MSTGVERWAELRDREALGEPLSERDREECEALETRDPDVRAQASPYRELSRMLERASLERPNAQDRDLVDRALMSVRVTNGHQAPPSVDADAEIERAVDPEGPLWIRPTAVAISIILPAAAALALLFYEPKATPATGPVTTQLAKPALAPKVVALSHARTALRGPRLMRAGRALPSQTELVEGDRIESGTSAACLVIDPNVDVCLAPSSEVKLRSLSRSARRVEVMRGQAVARLDPQAKGDGFELSAGAVRALAQGTVYGLERQAHDEVRVRVLEGRVKVLAATHQADVSASQLATFRNSEEGLSVSPLAPGQTARMWELLSTRALMSEGVAKSGSDAPASDASVTATDAAVPQAPPPQGTESVTKAPATPSAPAEAVATADAQGKPDARTLLREAWDLLKAKRWADAAATYSLILRDFPKSDEAHVVLVRLGDLQLAHLDQPAQALASYQRYLREGGGPLDAEARYGVIQAFSRLGRVGAERAAIEEFLAKHSTSLKAEALRKRLHALPP